MGTTPPLPPSRIPLTEGGAWQDGWRAGWAQGATDEAEIRKIKSKKLSEIESCIRVLDAQGTENEDRALRFLRAVFFPNAWDHVRYLWLFKIHPKITSKRRTT